MAGYDNGVWEEGRPSEEQQHADPDRLRRLQDPNAGWHATGVTGGAVVSNQFGQDVDRYRQIGHQETQRDPIQINQGPAQQSRGIQMGALGLLRAQANGSAPSSAQILSQRGNQMAGRAAAQRVTGARGVGASVGAFGGANDAASQQALASNVQGASARAGEISHGQGAFTAGAGAVRGQDLGAATTNAQLDAQNRELAERQQQHYERMAFDTKNQEMQAANDAMNLDRNGQQQQRAQRLAESQADWQKAKDVASIGLGGFSALAGSDPRTKMNMGSLGGLTRRAGR